jgi:hypothetical protein
MLHVLSIPKKQRTSHGPTQPWLVHAATTSATRGHDEGLQKEEVPAALHGVESNGTETIACLWL